MTSWSGFVAEPRPFGHRDGAIRIDIDMATPKTCGAIHVENFDERTIVTQRHQLQRRQKGRARNMANAVRALYPFHRPPQPLSDIP